MFLGGGWSGVVTLFIWCLPKNFEHRPRKNKASAKPTFSSKVQLARVFPQLCPFYVLGTFGTHIQTTKSGAILCYIRFWKNAIHLDNVYFLLYSCHVHISATSWDFFSSHTFHPEPVVYLTFERAPVSDLFFGISVAFSCIF